jgi:3-hydroxyisobutyrate dehydrogenase-like beta-hydroxyacid dehydrogenase
MFDVIKCLLHLLHPAYHVLFTDILSSPLQVGPSTADKLERACSSVPNRHFLSAPVFGPPPLAKSAGLIMAIAGQYHAKKRVSHAVCPAVVRKVMDLGSDVERAAKFKLTGNAMVLGCMELLAETMTLADQSGVGAEKVCCAVWVMNNRRLIHLRLVVVRTYSGVLPCAFLHRLRKEGKLVMANMFIGKRDG